MTKKKEVLFLSFSLFFFVWKDGVAHDIGITRVTASGEIKNVFFSDFPTSR